MSDFLKIQVDSDLQVGKKTMASFILSGPFAVEGRKIRLVQLKEEGAGTVAFSPDTFVTGVPFEGHERLGTTCEGKVPGEVFVGVVDVTDSNGEVTDEAKPIGGVKLTVLPETITTSKKDETRGGRRTYSTAASRMSSAPFDDIPEKESIGIRLRKNLGLILVVVAFGVFLFVANTTYEHRKSATDDEQPAPQVTSEKSDSASGGAVSEPDEVEQEVPPAAEKKNELEPEAPAAAPAQVPEPLPAAQQPSSVPLPAAAPPVEPVENPTECTGHIIFRMGVRKCIPN